MPLKKSLQPRNDDPRNRPFVSWGDESMGLRDQFLPREFWCRAHTQAQAIAEELEAKDLAIGIAHHRFLGWCVLSKKHVGRVAFLYTDHPMEVPEYLR